MRSITFLFISLLVILPIWGQITTVKLPGPDGQVKNYTLRSHPRIWLDGANGPMTLAVRDPDGPGPARSPRASGPLWDALVRHNNGMQKKADLDLSGTTALSVAVGYFLDNNAKFPDGTTYKDFVRNQINRIEEVWVDLGACDRGVNFCGTATMYPITHVDYMGYHQVNWAMAYTLIRNALTPAERSVFAEKALNGISKSILPNCENRLERLPETVRIEKTDGGATIKGERGIFQPEMLNQWYYVKPSDLPHTAGAYIRPTALRSSNTLFTSTVPYYSYLDKRLDLYRVKPWASGQCGFGFVSSHHGNVPNNIVGYSQFRLAAALSETDTVMTITTAAGLPKQYPFYVKIRGTGGREIVRVTAVDGNQLTIIRGEFSSAIRAWPSNTVAEYSTHDVTGDDTGWNNRTLTRHVGQMTLALALADDDPRALSLLTDSVEFWNKNTWFAAKNYFTLASTSTNSYGYTRLVPYYMWIIQGLYNSFDPVLDYRSDWLKRAGSLFYLYWYTPWDPTETINWGIPSSNCQAMKSSADFQCAAPAAYMSSLYPEAPETGYARQWLEEMGITTNNSVLSLIAGQRVLIPLLLYPQAGAKDYKNELLPHYVGNMTDDDDKEGTTNFSVAVSRTDWSKDASMLYVLAPDHNTKEFPLTPLSDKFYDSYNADYGIGKGGWLLGQLKPDGSWMRFTGFQNVVDFGPLSQSAFRPWADLEIDRKKDKNKEYFYIRTDLTKGYGSRHKVQSAYRYFLHFKSVQTSEHIIVYDDVETKQAQRIRSMLHYGNNGEGAEGNTQLSNDGRIVESWHTKGKLFTTIAKVSGAGIITDLNVAVSSNTATVGTYCTTDNPCRATLGGTTYAYSDTAKVTATPQPTGTSEVYIWLDPNDGRRVAAGNHATIDCAGGIDCGSKAADFPSGVIRLARMTWTNNRLTVACPGQTTTTRGLEYNHCVGGKARHIFLDAGDAVAGAEFLVVHKPGDLSIKPDPVAEVRGISGGFTGIEVLASTPKVAVFAKGGVPRTEVQFETQHKGIGQYVVAGLGQGTYQVLRNGVELHSNLEVDGGEEAVYFESSSGIIQVQRVGTITSLSITTGTLTAARLGEPYSLNLRAAGGEPPYYWNLVEGRIPPGMELSGKGLLTGIPTEAGVYSFALLVTDATSHAFSQSFQLNAHADDPDFIITSSSMGDPTKGVLYSFTFQARGGTMPYEWQITDGELPEGLSLEAATGVISGTPAESGQFLLSIRATDANGFIATKDLSIEVAEPE